MQASQEIGTLLFGGISETSSKKSKRIKGNFSSVFSKKIPQVLSKNMGKLQQIASEKSSSEKTITLTKATEKPSIKKSEPPQAAASEEPLDSKKHRNSKHESVKDISQKSPHEAAAIPVQFTRSITNEQAKNEAVEDEKRSLKKIEKQDAQIPEWTVLDQRKQKTQTQSPANTADMPVKHTDQGKPKQEPEILVAIRQDQNFHQEPSSGQSGAIRNDHQSFAEVLTKHLEGASQEIVKTAQIVLQDNDSGIIRLRLEPETLGGVKIELKLAEKKISGTIVVESDIVQAAFKDSYAALRDAFNSQGFELTQLDINVSNGNNNAESYENKKPVYAQNIKKIEQTVPEASGTTWTLSSGLKVNLVI